MPVILVMRNTIKDPEGYERYHEVAGPPPANARIVARGPESGVKGEKGATRTAILEFASEADFHAWYDNPPYSDARKIRDAAADCECFLVDSLL